MRYFTFNAKDSRNYFELTNEIIRPYLPPITVPSVSIPNRAGAIGLKRNEIGVREFEIRVTMLALNHLDLRNEVRLLSDFLIYTEDKESIFSDEPNKRYFARYSNDSAELEEIAYTGEGTLTFVCFDPYAYALGETTLLISGQESVFVNNGTAPVFPRLRLFSTIDNTFVKIINKTTGKVLVYNAIWKAWEYLVLDCSTNRVYRETDNVNFIKNLSLESEFFELVQGENLIRIENQNGDGTGVAGQLRVYWTERYW